jgi:hypothetical protein
MRQHALLEQQLSNQQTIPDEKPVKTWLAIRDNLSTEQKNRLWEHHLHADDVLYNRLNFFLVFQSVLLGVVGVLYSKSISEMVVLRIIIILGIIVTIIWGYAQARQKYVLDRSRARIQEVLPEYQAIVEDRERGKWPFSSVKLLTYCIPPLIMFVWIALLFYTLLT